MRVLFSIHPEYAESILDGSKKFEFRRRIYARNDVKTVVIYATAPIGMIIGEFDIGEVLSDTPENLWARTKKHAGIDLGYFSKYFDGREEAFAISVKKARRYKKPVSLVDVFPESPVAPQSFRYMAA